MSIGATYRQVSSTVTSTSVLPARQATLGIRIPLSMRPNLSTSTPQECLSRSSVTDSFEFVTNDQCFAARIALAYSAPAPWIGFASSRFVALDVGIDYLWNVGTRAPRVLTLSLDYSMINGQDSSENARLLRLRGSRILCRYLEVHSDLVRLANQRNSPFGFFDYLDPGRSQTIASIGVRYLFDLETAKWPLCS